MEINYFYFVQVLAISALFSVFYFTCLRKNTKHHLNRYVLLSSILLSLLLPLINIQVEVNNALYIPFHTENLIDDSETEIEHSNVIGIAIADDNKFKITKLLPGFFFLVCGFFLLRLLNSYRLIIQKIRNNHALKHKQYKVIFDPTIGQPFSFFKWIFIPAGIQNDEKLYEAILAHETTHAKCWHSLDMLLMNCITLILWWNPFFYYLKRQLLLTHEFEADAAAVKHTGILQYAEILLRHVFYIDSVPLTHSFYQSPIKSRIMMLINPSKQRSYQWISLPLAGLIMLIFSTSFKNSTLLSPLSNSLKVVVDVGHGGHDHGASAHNHHEKDLNLALAKALQQQAAGSNISIILTRSEDALPVQGDVQGSLKKRVAIVQETDADVMVSLHIGAEPPRSANKMQGVVAYVAGKNDGNAEMSKPLASALLNNLTGGPLQVQAAIQQRRTQGLYVLDNNIKPAVLLEVGFITNKNDVAILSTEAGINNIAERILKGLQQYAEKEQL